MAVRKSINLLPGVFQTDANEKFLSATIDQLISEPSMKNLYGYIGRKFSPTYHPGDSYVTEDTNERQTYQLEPSTIIKNDQGEITFFASYVDFLNQIRYYGGLTDNQSRLFNSEFYSFDPSISYDKFVNFSQYYWLPNGPVAVAVNTTGVELITNFDVTRNDSTNSYEFANSVTTYNAITLARGGTYTFNVSQDSNFWIQSELGVNGKLRAIPLVSSRDVLGVENNGAQSGQITFAVPQKNAQERFINQTLIASVDYASPTKFADLQNQYLSDFIDKFPSYAGIVQQFDGKQLIFVGQNQSLNLGEEAWTVGGTTNSFSLAYPKDSVVPEALRFGIWQVQLITVGDDKLINLFYLQNVPFDQKVYVKFGVANANKEWYKEFDGFFHQTPLLTSLQDTLYIQDGTNPNIYATIKIVDYNNFTIDVEKDIIGQKTYTSPNGVAFTSGLKIQFDVDVTPAKYQNKTYYVENVGDSINLVDVDLLVTPELYNDELKVNYPINRIIIDQAVTEEIPAGTTITIGTATIVTDKTVLKGSTDITTLNDLQDANGVNIIDYGMAVQGPGIPTGTAIYDAFTNNVFPEYITIKRDTKNLNAWSRNNRWFHVDVIKTTAKYNNINLIIDQNLRAQRPIVQFERDLQLFNEGRFGKPGIDILDTNTTDAFETLEGQSLSFAFGVPLFDGMRVLFAVDQDPLVRNKIYVINLVQYSVDNAGVPSGPRYIKLTKAEDGDNQEYDTVVVKSGQYKGSQWWFDGSNWKQSQQKSQLQQDPIFDIFTYDPVTMLVGTSLSDLDAFPRSNFKGTRLFGYTRQHTAGLSDIEFDGINVTYINQTGTPDSVLGFALKYRSLTTQGDIEFQNYFNTDSFTYVIDQLDVTEKINRGFLLNAKDPIDRNNVDIKNTWATVVEPSKQYQILTFDYTGATKTFQLDITPETTVYIPTVKVYQYTAESQKLLKSTQWSLAGDNRLTVNATLSVGDQIVVLIYSKEVSSTGYYEVPQNLNLNAQNVDIETVTLGQIRNHLIELNNNSTTLVGDSILGANNLRDIEIKGQGGSILQHSSPIPYAKLFLMDDQANFIEAVRFAQREYNRFKNKFLELAGSLPGVQPTDPVASVDLIIAEINKNKNPSFPWYYSDMVPYGTFKYEDPITIFDPLTTTYKIRNVFLDKILSNQSVIVYYTPSTTGIKRQLIKDIDFSFNTTSPSITINSENLTLNVSDELLIVSYADTNGSYVPETPSKLGTYPKYIPEIFLDDTYRAPISVIRGHDGSLTPAFNDYRDDIILELEQRIYNNIKLPDTGTYQDIFTVAPGKFRTLSGVNDYNYQEVWSILSNSFLTWVGNNKIDFTLNQTFESNDAFTWNYSDFLDRIDGENLPGSWRACYLYFYDTIYPHIRPWEMLGFATKPDWWEGFYGPGPYTGGNALLWSDLERGLIRGGPRGLVDDGYGPGIDNHFSRPGLSQIIPVDENGFLLTPAQILAVRTNATRAASAWSVGELGPTEYAWRISSDFPYAVQIALALAKPATYFAEFIDTYNIYRNDRLDQLLTVGSNHHTRQIDLSFNGDTTSGAVYRGAGYLNWIADYLTNLGINPATKILPMLRKYTLNLAYKMGGFSDQKYLQVLAEQSSPSSTSASVIIPNENYDVHLYKSSPIDKLIYSAVIVEKTDNGYSVRGYDLNKPFFTIIPSQTTSNAYQVSVLNSNAVIFNNYLNQKLTVPYGNEYTSTQQVVDFLISYQRYLLAQGFTFTAVNTDLSETQDWGLSVKEFLFWSQQGWKPGSILVLSPTANSLSAITQGSIVDGISDSQLGSKILDQNFNLIKNTNYTVKRSPTDFSVTLEDPASVIAYAEFDLVQYEHILAFDNVTVFNDVIYEPQLGNRQYRLKLVGQKTDLWDGSLYAPGFIYNSKTVQSWVQGKDYLQGDLVIYKNQYYTALQNITASVTFEFQYWKQLENSEIQTGLLSNFSTIAVGSQSFYDSYGEIKDNNQLQYSHGLIGFRNRQYLSDLGLSETTQIEFYKGFIGQKGTNNAVNALTKAQFNNLNSAIEYYEEWAVRVGEYGAISSNPFVEIALDEKTFSVNPQVARFVSAVDNNQGDGLTVFNSNQLFKSDYYHDTNLVKFDGELALLRDESSSYENDIPTAGYVNLEDIDITIFDLNNYVNLNVDLVDVGSSYTIWSAKDFTGNWNVYRVTETNNAIIALDPVPDSTDIIWTSRSPHQLEVGELFVVKNFNNNLHDGFYRVKKIVSLTKVQVDGSAYPTVDTPVTGELALFLTLISQRFVYMEDARVYGLTEPKHLWQIGEKLWIDQDAAVDTIQGQPSNVPKGWKVYEKQSPWVYAQSLLKSDSDYATNDQFGSAVKLTYDGLLAISGSPLAKTIPEWNLGVPVVTGKVNTFNKNSAGEFTEGLSLLPEAGNAIVTTKEYGFSLYNATQPNGTYTVAVGAPGSYGNVGMVYIYERINGTTTYSRSQVIMGNISIQGRFGSSIVLSKEGRWLFVGAPGDTNNPVDKVYVYGLNTHVTTQTQTKSVSDENIIKLSSNVTVTYGDIIRQPLTGGYATVVQNSGNTANIQVDTLTNFTSNVDAIAAGVNLANIGPITINNVDSGWAYQSYHRSVTKTINLNFVPDVATAAESLLITNSAKTFIPGIDFTLASNVVTFSGNIVADTYVIQQKPYFTLQTILQGNTGTQFGYALASSLDGAQLAIGAPKDNVVVNGTTIVGAGTVSVYDRVIESFNSTGRQDYITVGNVDLVHRVTIDDLEVVDYQVPGGLGSHTIRFNSPPAVGKVINIETNEFKLLEQIIGVDDIVGGTDSIQTDAAFGTSITICFDNCAIYVGAPGYSQYPLYNTGGAFKFHNQGRLYGTNKGYAVDPTFTPGDSIRINNFEINVSARMMPTVVSDTSAYILTVSGNVRANVGDVITQSGSSANVTVLASTEVVGSEHIVVSNYANVANTFNYGQSISGANVITIGGNVTTVFPKVSLSSLIQDINDAGIVGVTAFNENGALSIKSNSTVARKYLQILAGNKTPRSKGVYAEADMQIFAFMQIMTSPYQRSGEYFGSKVILAQNAYSLAIGSARGTTQIETTFDNLTTYVDDHSTMFRDPVTGSGSMYIFELYDDPRDDVEHPGRYQFAQQLDPGQLVEGDGFGTAFDLIGNQILVSAPGSDKILQDSGILYMFNNPTGGRGWKLIRYQEPRVDIDSIRRMYLYSSLTNTILTNLEIIDPAKGKILGQAEEEITWKSIKDPAIYNKGSRNPNENIYWGAGQVNQVWWNLEQVRFVDYEQSDLTYRSINWGGLFPGSVVEVCEWVESTVLPSQYIDAGYDGIPKYVDNSAYVEVAYVDPTTNVVGSLYYFWVTGKTSLTGVDPRRQLPIQTIADYIANPKGQSISYAAAIRNNAIILYNISQYLSAKDTILHIDYETIKNSSTIHSEYALLQNGNPISFVPEKIAEKLIDSLSGIDRLGSVVPDPALSLADSYGINIRPRQSMFVNRLAAMKDLVEYVNTILRDYPIERQYSLGLISSEESQPNIKLGEYDLKVATEIDLTYVDTSNLPTGYKVLVDQNTVQDNLWILYTLSADKSWEISRIQSYKSTLYWEFIDWFAKKPDGTYYSLSDKLDFVVDTLPDALKLPVISGEEILVRVNTSNVDSGWNLFTVNDQLELQLIGIEKGTIQLKKSLGNFADYGLGFNNQGFDSARFDQNPNVETRYIIQALRDEIFVGELQGEFNRLFFVMVNYLFNEQKYVDWIFKTSFTSITHDLRSLNQPAYYINDNLTYYEDYINEVKPFRTTIREYLTRYTGKDLFQGSLTDFDLAPYYDPEIEIFRSPSGEEVAKDEQLWATGYNGSTLVNADYTNWYNNRDLIVDHIVVVNGGSGYSTPPLITITGGGTGSVPATAVARINADTGSVSSITVTSPGRGYFTTPTVTINGSTGSNVIVYGNAVVNSMSYTYSVSTVSGLFVGMSANAVFTANAEISSIDKANLRITMTHGNLTNFSGNAISFGYPGQDFGTSATAYAELKNYQVRSFDTHIKFDRVNYKTTVQSWSANTTYLANTVVTYGGQGYRAIGNVTTGNIFSGIPFELTSPEEFNNANDRIMAYYQPGSTMPVIDVITVPLTLANSATNTNTIYVFPQDAMIKGMYISGHGVIAGQITKILGNAAITLDGVPTTVSQVTLSVNVTLLADQTITATYNSMSQLITGIDYPNLPMTGYNFKISPLFGTGFDDTAYDPVTYSRDGSALLSSSTVDVAHSSLYTNILLGTNPEDITPDGGNYLDRYHSHAPEELVPGILFDTLNMKVYTANVITPAGNVIVGYQQFTDMIGETTFTRVSDQYTTFLTQDLLITDTEIVINDASILAEPSLTFGRPGIIFIGSERIVYWRNYSKEVTPWLADTAFAANTVLSYSGNTYITTAAINSTTFDLGNVRQLPSVNILGQIRRGTLGTGTPTVQVNSTTVVDASADQVVPTTGNIISNIHVWYNPGDSITTATDGLGFAGSTTDAVNFLREYNANTSGSTASAPTNALIIESADASVNAIFAEDGINIIITE